MKLHPKQYTWHIPKHLREENKELREAVDRDYEDWKKFLLRISSLKKRIEGFNSPYKRFNG